MQHAQIGFWRNLRDLPGTITLPGVIAGFIVMLFGYTGPLLIILQAAERGGLTEAQTSSWVWAVTIGNGVMTILLSIYYRMPITAPWSSAGTALLVTSLVHFTLPQAIGAYILCAIAIILLGMSGLFGWAMARIPQPIVMAMLAGVLLRFGIDIFNQLPGRPALVIAMLATFFILRRLRFTAPTLGVLIVGVVMTALAGELNAGDVNFALTIPVFTLPEFTLEAALSLALPLFVVAVTAQYAPGQAVLRSFGYEPPVNGIMIWDGLASIPLAFFGGPGQNLGALSSALVTAPDAHPDATKRYGAAVMAGVWYVLFGVFGATIVGLFATLPAALVATIAGLALMPTISGSLSGAVADPDMRDAALVTFLCTAGDFTLIGIGAPFWGLVIGMGVYGLLHARQNVLHLTHQSEMN